MAKGRMNLVVLANRAGGSTPSWCCILHYKRVCQQLCSSPSLHGLPLQATVDEILKLPRRCRRRLWRRRHTNGAHQASPISLPSNCKWKPTQIKFQYADPQTPYIPSIPIILPLIQIRVDSLWTHIRNRSNARITWVHCLSQNSTHPKISNLNLTLPVD